MSDEELREINGIKPSVWLEDGAEREVSSQSRYELESTALSVFKHSFFSNSVYKVKRTWDHYYWYVFQVSFK